MSVSSPTARLSYTISALPATLPVFEFNVGLDLVLLDGGASNTGNSPALILQLGSDYTVTGGGYNALNQLQPGAAVVVANGISNVQVGDVVTVLRNVPLVQNTTLSSTGPLTVAQVEEEDDTLTTLIQQLNDVFANCLRYPANQAGVSAVLPGGTRAGLLLGFDSNGVPAFYLPSFSQGMLGTMALQNANLVAITGGSITGLGILGVNNTLITSSDTLANFFAPNLANGSRAALVFGKAASANRAAVIGYVPNATANLSYIDFGFFANNGLLTLRGDGLLNLQGNMLAAAYGTGTIINVHLSGAKGDGTTNDTAAIALAVLLAVGVHGTLYFPPGVYITDEIDITGATGLTILGDGMGVSTIKSRTGSVVLRIDKTSHHINVRGLTFNGNCAVRTAGQQAVFFDCSYSSFCDNEVINSGEYAFFSGSTSTQVTDIIVSRNVIGLNYADGINFQYVTRSIISNNIIDGADDDCIALGYNGTGAASFIEVVGNYCRARVDLGTSTGRGILCERVSDCLIQANNIDRVKQDGIRVVATGGTRPTRIKVIGNKLKGVATVSGNAMIATETTDCDFIGNIVDSPVNTSSDLFNIADWVNLTIQGGVLTQRLNQYCRGIHTDEGAGWAASWTGIKIVGVHINLFGASNVQSVYLAPHAGVTMNTGCVLGVVSDQVNAADCININTGKMGTLWKIGNNTTLNGNAFSPAASAGVYTVFNNN